MRIKEKIIQEINSMDNEVLLEQFYRIIKAESKIDTPYNFSKKELDQVKEGIDNAENGKVYNNKQAKKLVSQWLKEKSDGL